MEAKVNKWGNSLAIRLPAQLAHDFFEGIRVRIERKDGALLVTPQTSDEPDIDTLIKNITPQNLNIAEEWSDMKAVGREVL